MQDFRVIDLPERTTLDSSDYTMIDSAENGTNKYLLSRQAAETDAKIATAVGGVEAELDAAVEGIEEDITALQGDVETVETTLGTKADTDGTYPDMAVGSVLGTNTVTDREPYFLRPSASIGDREFDTLVGGSLGWNQLIVNGDFATDTDFTYSNVASHTVANGVCTFIVAIQYGSVLQRKTIIKDHKYLATADAKTTSGSGTLSLTIGDNVNFTLPIPCSVDNSWKRISAIVTTNTNVATASSYFCVRDDSSSDWKEHNIKNLNFIDLTTLFGSTIADYIYSLEQAHAGDGVAWVRRYLPNDYYAYCAPTLKHVSGVSAHVMRDANNNVIGNYAIDSTWTGMGIPKLDSDNKLYFDGDRYASDGTVTERYEIVDLGTLNWTYDSSYNRFINNDFIIKASPTDFAAGNLICAKYATDAVTYTAVSGYDKIIGVTNAGKIRIRDTSYTDAATFKTAMSGVYLVYEKAIPTTSTASPYTSPQICDKDGTEEYVTTGLVPVGHETEYVENLADKLTDIPDLPTTAGTYSLKVTVSGGVPSYSWVSA